MVKFPSDGIEQALLDALNVPCAISTKSAYFPAPTMSSELPN